jgi:Bacterial PH domain
MRHNAPVQPLVFRSTVARVVAWIFVAFAALNLVDVIIRGRGQSGRVAFAVLVAIALIAYVLGLRPGVVANSQQVQLRNPLRDVSVPWNAVTAIDSTDALRIHSGPAVFRSWAIAAGNRARRRALGRQSAAGGSAAIREDMAGRTHADFVVDQLTQVWKSHRGNSAGAPQISWSWPAIACLVAAGLLILGTVLLG